MYEMPYRYEVDARSRTYSPVLQRMVELSRPMRRAVAILEQDGYVDKVDVTVGTICALMDRGILRESTPLRHGSGAGRNYPATTPEQVWDEAHRLDAMCCTLNPLDHGRDECPAAQAEQLAECGPIDRAAQPEPEPARSCGLKWVAEIGLCFRCGLDAAAHADAIRSATDEPDLTFNTPAGADMALVTGEPQTAPRLADDVAALRAMVMQLGRWDAPPLRGDMLAALDRLAAQAPQAATDDEGWPLYRSPCGDVRGWYGERPTDDRLYCELCNDSHAMSTEWQALYTLGGEK